MIAIVILFRGKIIWGS